MICCDCGGEVVCGPPLQRSQITDYQQDGPRIYFQFRCEHCSDRHARDLWTEEDWGPCPHVYVDFHGCA
jgi:hypothetical protein